MGLEGINALPFFDLLKDGLWKECKGYCYVDEKAKQHNYNYYSAAWDAIAVWLPVIMMDTQQVY